MDDVILSKVLKHGKYRYYTTKQNKIDKKPPIIIEYSNNFFSENIQIKYIFDGNIELNIHYKNLHQKLNYFKDFTFKINNKIVDCYLFHISKNLEEIYLALDYYLYYRDIIFDLHKISAKYQEEFYIQQNMLFMFPFKNKKFIKIPELPVISHKIGKDYLDKINRLIKYIPKEKEIEILLEGENYPSTKILFSYSEENLQMYFGIFGIFFHVDKINKRKKFIANSKMGIIFSYLNYFNLFDEFYINLEKELLSELL